MPEVSWSGRQFSMRDVHPAAAPNPVTQVLNMVMAANGSLEPRRAFDSNPGGTPQNHIVAELNGTPFLIIKDGTTIKYSSGGGFTTLAMASSDPPINSGVPASGERGSFALHGDEIYYCDSQTIIAWDGVNPGRRPGVIGLQGKTYNGTGDALLPGGPFGKTPTDDPATDADYLVIPSEDPTHPDMDPGIVPPNEDNVLAAGEKTLNTAFAVGYYDPKRRIYGRRSETFAYPFIFGPPDADGSNQILTDERSQFAKVVKVPTSDIHEHYKVAIWFSLGQQVLTNEKSTVFSGHFFYLNEAAPSMSKRMTQTVFLEKIVEAGSVDVFCTKDNTTLYQSGRYIDAYERPVPAKFMAILSNGTAIYFFPWTSTPENGGSAASIGNHAIYSVRHPEQIGLDTETQRDTISLLPNLKGAPQSVLSDGEVQLLLTQQAIYSIGFDGGVLLNELTGGRGVRSLKSIANSAVGVLWFADEGVVWVRGGQMTLLDEKLGFARWFEGLSANEKAAVVIGAADSMKQIMVFVTDIDEGGQRALVFDYERDFVSQFSGFGTANYATHFRSSSGSQLWVFGAGKYPGTGYTSEEASVTAWVNDGINRVKKISSVSLDLGPRNGSVSVELTSHFAGEDDEAEAPQNESRTQTLTASNGGAGRFNCPAFQAMRGKLFKIKVTGPSSYWTLNKIRVEFEYEDGLDADSA